MQRHSSPQGCSSAQPECRVMKASPSLKHFLPLHWNKRRWEDLFLSELNGMREIAQAEMLMRHHYVQSLAQKQWHCFKHWFPWWASFFPLHSAAGSITAVGKSLPVLFDTDAKGLIAKKTYNETGNWLSQMNSNYKRTSHKCLPWYFSHWWYFCIFYIAASLCVKS